MAMKSIARKTMIFAVFCGLLIFPASANFSNSDVGWKSSPAEVSAVSSTGGTTLLDQGERKPFGEENAPNSPLRAKPGDGTAQKEVTPVGSGLWIIIGLAMAYGVVCRKFRKETWHYKFHPFALKLLLFGFPCPFIIQV